MIELQSFWFFFCNSSHTKHARRLGLIEFHVWRYSSVPDESAVLFCKSDSRRVMCCAHDRVLTNDHGRIDSILYQDMGRMVRL